MHFCRLCSSVIAAAMALAFGGVATAPSAEARTTQIIISRVESPTFSGASFGAVGQFEKLVGTAYGELNPRDPHNRIIQDLTLAPRNAKGMVEYAMDVYIIKPVNMKAGNQTMLYDVVNRGNKIALGAFNIGSVGGNEPTSAGDGFLQSHGFTLVWSGWQGDVLPGNNRMAINVPVVTNPDGSPITARIRTEYVLSAPATTQNLSSGWFSGATHASYETVSLNNAGATLTQRVRESDPRQPIANSQWAFADCSTTPFPGVPSTTKICLNGGFDTNHIYELLYTAKNPTVLGIGFAASRDLVAFLRHARKDDAGRANPLARGIDWTLVHGSSQSGRWVRTFIDLGFNESEDGRQIFDGANPHISPLRLPLNVRFGQPGRGPIQHEDHLFPAGQAPYTWSESRDPISGTRGGILERCEDSETCPKIIQTVSSTEFWGGRMAQDIVDPSGHHDVKIPHNVHVYHLAGTQHAPAATPVLSVCQQLNNPNPQAQALRALLLHLRAWVVDGVRPPPSRYANLHDRTLVPPDQTSVGWPNIPGVNYTGIVNPAQLVEYGSGFDADDESGILTEPPVLPGPTYAILVPKVDPDGNEVDGIRSVAIQAPIATYTGWNLRRAGFSEGETCPLAGMFLPFATTKAQRLASGDPRLSLEERYGTHAGYVAAVQAAANRLVADGFLLPDDAATLVQQAQASSVLQ